ncbi:MAG TPA: cytochrome C oxidase subunit IV family protein [Stenomitos sp.]
MTAIPRLLRVYLALMILFALTAGFAYLPLGRFNVVVALAIAAAKATLIGMDFMELRTEKRLTWLFAGAGLFWLAILFTLSLSDYATRGWLPWGSRFGP